jgi:PrtD family type I secretion system ABC transporter
MTAPLQAKEPTLKITSDSPLRNALMRARTGIAAIVLLSVLINVFVLNGSIYMMLVYDRALPSASLVTLLGLFAMATVIYVFQGGLDLLRGSLLSDLAASLDEELSMPAAIIGHQIALHDPDAPRNEHPLQDLEQIRSFLAGPGPVALIDLPWVIFFLGVLTLLHVWLGLAALAGALVMVLITVRAEAVARKSVGPLAELGRERERLLDRQYKHVEALAALGMGTRFATMLRGTSRRYSERQREFGESTSLLATASKTTRTFIQSVLLTVGSVLVLQGEATGGIIFASSILSGRALAPVDQAIGQWRAFARTRTSWRRLEANLRVAASSAEPTVLPLPKGHVEFSEVEVLPPGSKTPTLVGVSFAVSPGSVVGVIGPSGSGKSTLLRALVGAWPLASGEIRLDGATLDQWNADRLGSAMGYLPQNVELLAGTIAQNIARFDPEADPEAILKAAKAAGVHDLIVKLPGGYDCQVGEAGSRLSGGQRQRIGLARALYGEPAIVVLDEPNSNLDPSGDNALSDALAAFRQSGTTALIVTHRKAILSQTTHLLRLNRGKVAMFGPTNQVVERLIARANTRNLEKVAANA